MIFNLFYFIQKQSLINYCIGQLVLIIRNYSGSLFLTNDEECRRVVNILL